jgi:hypothetical protein
METPTGVGNDPGSSYFPGMLQGMGTNGDRFCILTVDRDLDLISKRNELFDGSRPTKISGNKQRSLS